MLRLVTKGTVEEVIHEMQLRKKRLDAKVLDGPPAGGEAAGGGGKKGGGGKVEVKSLPKVMDPMAAMAKRFAVSNGVTPDAVVAKFKAALDAGKKRKVSATSLGWQKIGRAHV